MMKGCVKAIAALVEKSVLAGKTDRRFLRVW